MACPGPGQGSCRANLAESLGSTGRARPILGRRHPRIVSLRLRHRAEPVQEIDERADHAVDAEHLRRARLDEVELVAAVRALAVAEAEVDRGQVERLAGEQVPGPRAAAA